MTTFMSRRERDKQIIPAKGDSALAKSLFFRGPGGRLPRQGDSWLTSLSKIPFLGEAEIIIKSLFGDVGLSILGPLIVFNTLCRKVFPIPGLSH